MRSILALTLTIVCVATASAHHPDRENKRVHPYYDLIGPIGNRLPISHRRAYNRPTYWGGKIAYWIEPTSQEAMAWHNAEHRNAYKNHRPRIEVHYFYPKPWEALKVGARPAPETAIDSVLDALGGDEPQQDEPAEEEMELPQPLPAGPLTADEQLIE